MSTSAVHPVPAGFHAVTPHLVCANAAEAIAFYERAGYRRRGPFGDYQDDPNSVFMEKRLPMAQT